MLSDGVIIDLFFSGVDAYYRAIAITPEPPVVSRISHALFRIAITLVAAVVLTIIALGARLFAPIQLTWLAPYLERALAPSHQQIRFEIQNAGVRLGKRRAIELVGAGVQAKGADGEVLIDLPEIQIGISPRALSDTACSRRPRWRPRRRS